MFITAAPPLLHLLPILLLPVPLLASKNLQSISAYYDSLRNFPRLPPHPSPLQRIRYATHKFYFRFLVTGPGYVLEPSERILWDVFILVLFGAIVYFVYLVAQALVLMGLGYVCRYWSACWGAGEVGLGGGVLEEYTIALGKAGGDGNATVSVQTVVGLATGMAKVVTRNSSAVGRGWD